MPGVFAMGGKVGYRRAASRFAHIAVKHLDLCRSLLKGREDKLRKVCDIVGAKHHVDVGELRDKLLAVALPNTPPYRDNTAFGKAGRRERTAPPPQLFSRLFE